MHAITGASRGSVIREKLSSITSAAVYSAFLPNLRVEYLIHSSFIEHFLESLFFFLFYTGKKNKKTLYQILWNSGK